MKTLVITTIFAAFLSIATISAKSGDKITLTNIENTEAGCVKEYITYSSTNNRPLEKTIYQYNAAGNMQQRTFYTWDNRKGWTAVHKHNYVYNLPGDIASYTYTKWDTNKGEWSQDYLQFNYIYNGEGRLVTMVEMNNNDLIALK